MKISEAYHKEKLLSIVNSIKESSKTNNQGAYFGWSDQYNINELNKMLKELNVIAWIPNLNNSASEIFWRKKEI